MKYKNITRLMQIAMAIEPIPNKKGLTTRYKDIGDNLKLEYFIIGSINSGFVIEELMNRKSGEVSYDLLFKSTVQNQLHRGGLRVNAGQLQFLWPILLVIREYPSIKDFNLILDNYFPLHSARILITFTICYLPTSWTFFTFCFFDQNLDT